MYNNMDKSNKLVIPDEIIMSKICIIRGQKVMIDRDLAHLYGVETRRLKEAVRRNINRFPEDFMFELTNEEFKDWRSQFATSNSDKMGLRHVPFCFTEQGVAMLSSVLNSDTAIMVNIQIIRIFTKIRKTLEARGEILAKLNALETKGMEHDDKLILIFEYLEQLEDTRNQEADQKNRKHIGYK